MGLPVIGDIDGAPVGSVVIGDIDGESVGSNVIGAIDVGSNVIGAKVGTPVGPFVDDGRVVGTSDVDGEWVGLLLVAIIIRETGSTVSSSCCLINRKLVGYGVDTGDSVGADAGDAESGDCCIGSCCRVNCEPSFNGAIEGGDAS